MKPGQPLHSRGSRGRRASHLVPSLGIFFPGAKIFGLSMFFYMKYPVISFDIKVNLSLMERLVTVPENRYTSISSRDLAHEF